MFRDFIRVKEVWMRFGIVGGVDFFNIMVNWLNWKRNAQWRISIGVVLDII
jgi:hypothetical protein